MRRTIIALILLLTAGLVAWAVMCRGDYRSLVPQWQAVEEPAAEPVPVGLPAAETTAEPEPSVPVIPADSVDSADTVQ